jgi:putative DNA primase/helicase
LRLAKADLAVSPEELDTDPRLLNVENGTVDLRTGSLRPHLPEDLITKLAPVEFDPVAEASRFMKFLKQTLVDAELIAFVQRFLGYSLTGSTKERALSVLHGVGKNGKSTLVEVFQDLMGDYSTTTNPDVVMRHRNGDATAQYALAELKGVRLVSVSETKRGVELEEATVKQITGNDTIGARAPYGRPFAYRPQFTLWMSTNHKPEIPDGSEAIWDRMRLIPFTQRFDGKKADSKLPDKLREELSGVLAWAVKGCVEWREHGLGTSAAVDAATAEYRSETDVIERFFQDECEFGPDKRVTRTALFEAWESWCDAEGENPGVRKDFVGVLRERGVVKGFGEKRVGNERGWGGIGLTTHPSDPPSVRNQDSAYLSQKEDPVVNGSVHLERFSPEVLGNSSRENNYVENPSQVYASVRYGLQWEVEGVEWEYLPSEEK